MKFILKNNRVTPVKNQYILFDDVGKIKCYRDLTVKNAKKLSRYFELQPISPIDAQPMFNYLEVSAGEFYPLPF